MPKVATTLSDLQVRRLKEDGVYFVGGVVGLALRIKNFQKTFFFRYTSPVTKTRREITIGSYSVCSLKRAREQAAEYRMQISEGIDPLLLREETLQKQREEAIRQERAAITVSKLADLFIQYKDTFSDWSVKDRDLFFSRLGRYILPIIGKRVINEVTPQQIAEVLQPLWLQHRAVAAKTRQMLRQMFSWAKAKDYFDGANPVDPQVLQHLLPKRIIQEPRHHAMLAVSEMPRFMKALMQYEGIAARCLQFAILTATRSGNAREALWEEINWDKKQWIIPAEKMKASANGDHIVPLSDQAIELIRSVQTQGYSRYIFPSPMGNGKLSDAALKVVIRALHMQALEKGESGFVDPKQKTKNELPAVATPHGLARATFRTWAQDDELGNDKRFSASIAELCLHHKIDDAYNGAYERNQALKSRAEMMQAWADYCLPRGVL